MSKTSKSKLFLSVNKQLLSKIEGKVKEKTEEQKKILKIIEEEEFKQKQKIKNDINKKKEKRRVIKMILGVIAMKINIHNDCGADDDQIDEVVCLTLYINIFEFLYMNVILYKRSFYYGSYHSHIVYIITITIFRKCKKYC